MDRREMLKSVVAGGAALAGVALPPQKSSAKGLDGLPDTGLLVGYRRPGQEFTFLRYFLEEGLPLEQFDLCRNIIHNPHRWSSGDLTDAESLFPGREFGWGVDISIPWSADKNKVDFPPPSLSLYVMQPLRPGGLFGSRLIHPSMAFEVNEFLFTMPGLFSGKEVKGRLRSTAFNTIGVYHYNFDLDLK